jgi:hypothetical protein
VVEKVIVHYMKSVRKISDFSFPPGMAFPAFEIVAFLFLFPGLSNSCILAMQNECTPWLWKGFAAIILAGNLGLLGYLYSLIRTGDKLVSFSQTREGFNAAEDFKGYDRIFQFKNKHSETPGGRYKRLITALDSYAFGRWTPISAHGKYTAKIFQVTRPKIRPPISSVLHYSCLALACNVVRSQSTPNLAREACDSTFTTRFVSLSS